MKALHCEVVDLVKHPQLHACAKSSQNADASSHKHWDRLLLYNLRVHFGLLSEKRASKKEKPIAFSFLQRSIHLDVQMWVNTKVVS